MILCTRPDSRPDMRKVAALVVGRLTRQCWKRKKTQPTWEPLPIGRNAPPSCPLAQKIPTLPPSRPSSSPFTLAALLAQARFMTAFLPHVHWFYRNFRFHIGYPSHATPRCSIPGARESGGRTQGVGVRGQVAVARKLRPEPSHPCSRAPSTLQGAFPSV
jgi:hypothetical protein